MRVGKINYRRFTLHCPPTILHTCVQIWSPDGSPIMTSNHHNKQVESLLVTPLAPGGNTESSGKVSERRAFACQCVCTTSWGRGR